MNISDFLKVEATQPNELNIVSVRISYSTQLQQAIDLLIPAANLSDEMEKAQHVNENDYRIIKLNCRSDKFNMLLKLTKDVLARIQKLNNPNLIIPFDTSLN